MTKLTIIFITLFLQGCSMTLPVRGQIQNKDETFTGVATGYISGGGTLKIVSSKGAVCEGNFVYINSRQGNGIFTCNDGRSGPFEFVSTGSSGTGYGDLGKDRFTFSFGSF